MVLDGDIGQAPPDLESIKSYVIAIGDAKVKQSDYATSMFSNIIPGTIACYESWLAQPVQCCIDLGIPLGFVLTSVEIVLFHMSKMEDENPSYAWAGITRSGHGVASGPSLVNLPSDTTQEELEYSSPVVRQTDDWIAFERGDADVPLVSHADIVEGRFSAVRTPSLSTKYPGHSIELHPQNPSSPLVRKRSREMTPEFAHGASRPPLQHSPAPGDTAYKDQAPSSSLPIPPSSPPSAYQIDAREEDPTHVLIRSYSIQDYEDVGYRLFELILLAKRAQIHGVLGIGPFKLSHSALDQFESPNDIK